MAPATESNESVSIPDGHTSQLIPIQGDSNVRLSHEQTCGWLYKKARFSQKWRRQWFLVDRNILRYGNSEKDICKKIQLEGSRILESNMDNKSYAFSVQPRAGKRIYYLRADDEISRNKWMQTICFAKMVTGVEEKGTACAIL